MLSAVFLLVSMPLVKKLIIGSILTGFALQIAGFYVQEQYAGVMIIAGIGLVCVWAAGMVGKEAYCFCYREGWLLMLPAFPFVAIIDLLGKENGVLNATGSVNS